MSDKCRCAVPMPTSRRAERWNPTDPPPKCWTCGKPIGSIGWRVRDLSEPPVPPVHSGGYE